MEDLQVIGQELPIWRASAAGAMLQQQTNVGPIGGSTSGIVNGGLNFQADDILDLHHGHAEGICNRQAVRAVEHAKCRSSKRVEEIDASQGGVLGEVMGNILAFEAARVANLFQDNMGFIEILQQKEEVEIDG